jgi:hypothetical protein
MEYRREQYAMSDVQISEQVQKQLADAQDMTIKSMRTWNELLMTSADMAFDVVLKNWNYSRSLRSSADQAIEDTIRTQHRYTNEMMQVWRGYTSNFQDIVNKAVDISTNTNGKQS